MKTALILFSLLIFSAFIVTAGKIPTKNVWGKVIDKETSEPLSGVNVCLPDKDSTIGTITNLNGEFRLWNIPLTSNKLQVTSHGYKAVVVDIEKAHGTDSDFILIKLQSNEKDAKQMGLNSKKMSVEKP
ncbi:carboxypeptidase-like regulatory domain-containing protein [Gaoshiqia sediminis]|uniref:Carboxypeptidase-like regulatory domain-containing protein n=1 Tax=Gaoshiqia sediminis TaxID=2986998 RepID=A0AA42C8C1_9BACT|nr:carboxypeptidase-like regulatory domain-containing protein [Gaoshiqia sediminis]MCW0482551.1 carboxypeptidase-like regulatory domain-containing protein [Gaoshiqia sediminis]